MASPFSVTDQYDALLSTTLRHYMPRMADNIAKGNKVLAWLKGHGRMRAVNGGYQIAVPLMFGLNNTADIYSGLTVAPCAA